MQTAVLFLFDLFEQRALFAAAAAMRLDRSTVTDPRVCLPRPGTVLCKESGPFGAWGQTNRG